MAGDRDEAKDERKAWEQARRDWLAEHGTLGGFTDEPAPTEPIPSFDGGTIVFNFKRHSSGDGYTLTTFFPEPAESPGPKEEEEHS